MKTKVSGIFFILQISHDYFRVFEKGLVLPFYSFAYISIVGIPFAADSPASWTISLQDLHSGYSITQCVKSGYLYFETPYF